MITYIYTDECAPVYKYKLSEIEMLNEFIIIYTQIFNYKSEYCRKEVTGLPGAQPSAVRPVLASAEHGIRRLASVSCITLTASGDVYNAIRI